MLTNTREEGLICCAQKKSVQQQLHRTLITCDVLFSFGACQLRNAQSLPYYSNFLLCQLQVDKRWKRIKFWMGL